MNRIAPNRLSDADIARTRELAASGKTQADIADALGITRGALSQRCSKYGIVLANSHEETSEKYRECARLGMDDVQTAEYLEISVKSVRKWWRNHGRELDDAQPKKLCFSASAAAIERALAAQAEKRAARAAFASKRISTAQRA